MKEIFNTNIRGDKAITFPLVNYDGWIADSKGHHILDVRGWGHFQYADDDKGAEIQDVLAQWVVDTLNKEAELSVLINEK